MNSPLASMLRYPLFAVLDRARIADWVTAAPRRRFAIGEVLACRGENPRHLFLIEDGRVRTLQPVEGRDVTLGLLQTGALIGDHALLPPGALRSTARAALDTAARLLPLADLRDILDTDRQVVTHLRAWVRLNFATRALRDEPCLGFMSPTSFLPLLDRCHETVVRAGCAAQAVGLVDDSVFVVRSGRIVWTPDASLGGSPRELGAGDVFGAEVLAGRPLAGFAVADTDCVVARVTPAAFLDCPIGDPAGQSLTLAGSEPRPVECPWVGQDRAEGCGPAALAMVARAHGLAWAHAEISAQFVLDDRGASASQFCAVARAVGFRAEAVRLGADQLAEVVLPAVAHLSDGHYVVIYSVEPDVMTVGDPARGVVRQARLDFLRKWSGVAVLLRTPAPVTLGASVAKPGQEPISLLLNRLRGGDASAREDVIRTALARLERLARKMLRGFPAVRRWEETGDVLQNALVRLDRALRAGTPESSRAFIGLAAEQIRRELIDLARHYQGAHGHGRHVRSVGLPKDAPEPAAPETAADELERWTEFHGAVERLPSEEREAFSLTFYHGWPQGQIAELFGVDERTIRRRLRRATEGLTAALGGDPLVS